MNVLPKRRLVGLAEHFDLNVSSRETKAVIVDALARSRKASYERILEQLTGDGGEAENSIGYEAEK